MIERPFESLSATPMAAASSQPLWKQPTSAGTTYDCYDFGCKNTNSPVYLQEKL
jgi:hypothetical protein